MRNISVMIAALMLASGAQSQTVPTTPSSASAAVAPEQLSLARRVVAKARVSEQTTFALGRLSAVYADQVLAALEKDEANPFQSALVASDGRSRLRRMLSEEFVRSFNARVPELVDAAAHRLASTMTTDDLRSTDIFLGTRAGGNWAAALIAVQADGSAVGARIGSTAGAEAVANTLKRLETEKGARP